MTRVAFGHVENVELVETGTWPASTGPFTCTQAMIGQSIAALACPAVRRPVLKAGHDGNHGIGEPALGWCDNLRATNEGHTLVADFRGMPAWLTETDPAGNSVMASAYPDRSIEGERDYHCTLGHTHPFVVHAVSLLGVERPAAGTLESLQELYGLIDAASASDGGELITFTTTSRTISREAPVSKQVSAAATDVDVIRTYYDEAPWEYWIRELYLDPPELIVDNDATNQVMRVPYSIAADGTVTFGEEQVVKVTYVAARAQVAPALTAFASRAESRPGTKPAASETPAGSPPPGPGTAGATTEEEEGTMPDTLIDGLRKQLGLADDADEATVLAANAEALAERAETPPATQTETPPAPTALPDGTVAVDEETWQQTVAAAAAGQTARNEQLEAHRKGLVAAAIGDGRIAKAREEHWLTSLKADPGAETVLASLKPGTVVNLTEAGHAGTEDAAADVSSIRESATYKNWSMS